MSDSVFNYSVQAMLVQTGDPYTSPGVSGVKYLTRIQSQTTAMNYPRQDIFDWAGNGDQVFVEWPTVSQDFSYYLTNGANERNLGFTTDGTTPALAGLNSEQNYYTMVNVVNQDMLGYVGPNNLRVLALGNGIITNYSVNCAVGQIPNASVTIEGLNLLIQNSGSGQLLPAIDKQTASGTSGTYTIGVITDTIDPNDDNPANAITALRPNDIFLQFDTGSAVGLSMSGANACPVQSFSLNINLPRIGVKQMGWAYPSERPMQWPITVSLEAQAYITDYQLAALSQNVCPDSGYGINILMKQPCSDLLALGYYIQGAKLQSQSFSAQIGGYNRVTFSWTAKIYNVNDANGSNVFIESMGGFLYWLYDHSEQMIGYDASNNPYTYLQDYYREVAK